MLNPPPPPKTFDHVNFEELDATGTASERLLLTISTSFQNGDPLVTQVTVFDNFKVLVSKC